MTADQTYLDIDYTNHPAFNPYVPELPAETSALFEVFADIDREFDLLVNSKEVLPERFIAHSFDRMIRPYFEEIMTCTLSLLGKSSWYAPILPEILHKTQMSLLDEVLYRNQNKLLGPVPGWGQPGENLEDTLLKNRMAALKFPQEELSKILNALEAAGFKDQLMRQKEQEPWAVPSLPLPHEGPFFEMLSELLKAGNVFSGLSHLSGCPMKFKDIAFYYSTPDQEWYKGCYEDVGVPTVKTSYMHYDHCIKAPKCLLYLSEVGPENGPFSIIPDSRSFMRSYAHGVVLKFFDWVANEKAYNDPKYDMKYARRRYKVPELREELVKLPNQLRGTSHFGEDVLDGTPLSNVLLEREIVCTSDLANCVFFDGASTIHRGGLVEKGARWAFQIAFTRDDSSQIIH